MLILVTVQKTSKPWKPNQRHPGFFYFVPTTTGAPVFMDSNFKISSKLI